jgi:hypothetical protein
MVDYEAKGDDDNDDGDDDDDDDDDDGGNTVSHGKNSDFRQFQDWNPGLSEVFVVFFSPSKRLMRQCPKIAHDRLLLHRL